MTSYAKAEFEKIIAWHLEGNVSIQFLTHRCLLENSSEIYKPLQIP